ncbi:MAG: dethiobiotin synthase [Arenibacter sp.]|nr:dethiobiotin synthase [Arenibacter sp.]
MKQFFVTGISTGVGKTLAAAIMVEAMGADYWKPVQTGEDTDNDTVAKLISNPKTVIHKNSYALKAPISPHAAATLEGVYIDPNKIIEPQTERALVIEGAGGLLVPLNDSDTILDIIMPTYKVVVVSRHYLGSINHSLLTIQWLQTKGYDVAVLFSGNEDTHTEEVIIKKTKVRVIGRIDEESSFDKEVIKKYADKFRPALLDFCNS